MTTNPPELPTPAQFYIEYPLYDPVEFAEDQVNAGWDIKYSRQPVDAYCSECGSHSIFVPYGKTIQHEKNAWAHDHDFESKFACSRDNSHSLYFLIRVRGRSMQKIGQYPSLADLNLYDVKQYAPVLKKAVFRELTKAIGLAAHGVGVGSFVYLRRIFENLIEEAHIQAKADNSWDEETYTSSRVGEKIQLLANFLPKFLVENRAMYGILSKGIHELDENECLAAFPVVKLGIEIILDAHLKAHEEKAKLTKAAQAIQLLATATANKSS